MRNFMLGLSLSAAFIVGCLIGSGQRDSPSQGARAGTGGKPYLCIERSDGEDLTKAANQMHGLGYRMVAAAGAGWGSSPLFGKQIMIWCFTKT